MTSKLQSLNFQVLSSEEQKLILGGAVSVPGADTPHYCNLNGTDYPSLAACVAACGGPNGRCVIIGSEPPPPPPPDEDPIYCGPQ